MSRFNATIERTPTVNLAGGQAYAQDAKLELVSLLLTSFMQDQFYRKADESITRIRELITNLPDKKFAAQAAIYARTTFGMRSVSHVVAGELSTYASGQPWAKRFFDRIVYRPDDMTEILAYIFAQGGKETNAIRKGFAAAFQRFDAYQIAKYKKSDKKVSLVDVVNICHPKPTEAITALVKGTLAPADTWETKLSQAGQVANADEDADLSALKREVWISLITKRKIGYFALLRNLRNIVQQAPEAIPAACAMLTDVRLIEKSLVLPFRYISALEEMAKIPAAVPVIRAISAAIDIAMRNVPYFEGKTLVVLDTSGSMQGKPINIGAMFAAALIKSNDADYITFSTNAKYQVYNPLDTTVTIAAQMVQSAIGGSTDFHAIFATANRAYDRIIILSDMQGWVGYTSPVKDYEAYKRRTGCDPHVYSFDLAGHGTMQFPQSKVYCIAGFSPQVFDVMKLLETDRQALVHTIEAVEV